MEQWLYGIADLTLSGSIAILGVLIFRRMLQNQGKIFSYLLWIIVGMRLLLPISFEGVWGMLPMPELGLASSAVANIGTGERDGSTDAGGGKGVKPSENMESMASDDGIQDKESLDDMNHVALSGLVHEIELLGSDLAGLIAKYHVIAFLFWVWIAGVAVLAAKNVLAYFRLKKRVQISVREGDYYLSDHISGAFVLGLLKPRIYLSGSLTAEERKYILAHEKVHLRRRDYLWKWVAEWILCVHWFNPLAWLAFREFAADMEMSCDEAVLRRERRDGRAAYARVLLAEISGSRVDGIVPFFREGGTERRIHNMMKEKIVSKKRVAVCAGVVLAAAVLLIPSFRQNEMSKAAEEQRADDAEVQNEDICEEELSLRLDGDGNWDTATEMKEELKDVKGREYGYPTSAYIIYSGGGERGLGVNNEQLDMAARMVREDVARLGGDFTCLVYDEKKSNDLAKKHGCDLVFTVGFEMPTGEDGKSKKHEEKNWYLSKGDGGQWQIKDAAITSP
jgi:Antirepressor regulating drug resistance, predicted signal transduction N-terminal membrane component